jgi:hypothetical protein
MATWLSTWLAPSILRYYSTFLRHYSTSLASILRHYSCLVSPRPW